MKNKTNGLTLVETLISLGILILLLTGFVYYIVDKNKKAESNILGAEIVKYIKLIDQKSKISGYNKDTWPILEAKNYTEFQNFMYTNLNAKNSECGKSNGWTPIVDRTNHLGEAYKDKSPEEKERIKEANKRTLLGCDSFREKFSFDLIPTANVDVDSESQLVNSVDIILTFKSEADVEANFLLVKKALDYMKASDTENVSGTHYYTFVNKNNIDKDLKPIECFNLKQNCALKASFRKSGQSDYIRTDGLNSIVDNIVTFKVYDNTTGAIKSDLVYGVVKSCEKWINTAGAWSKSSSVKCGVGVYENNIVASFIDGNVSTNKTLYLNNQCNTYYLDGVSKTGPLAGVPDTFLNEYEQVLSKYDKVMPCGYYENQNELYILANDTSATEVNVGYKDSAGNDISKIEIAPTAEAIAEDYTAKLAYDANPTQITADEKVLNPSKGDFKKPSRTVVEKVADPYLSTGSENRIRNTKTKNLVIYEDLIVNSNKPIPPDEVFVTGELTVLNNYTTAQMAEISTNPLLSAKQKEEAIRNIQYSQVQGDAYVDKDLIANKLVVGDESLFVYDDSKKQYGFKNTVENNNILNNKLSGTPLDVANQINELSAKDIKNSELAQTKNDLKAESFQFKPSTEVIPQSACVKNGIIAANYAFELYICQNLKWEPLVSESGISAFNSESCPAGWRNYTEADGRFLIGTGYFDTIHNGVVRYKVGDKGGEVKHKLVLDEMPAHTHFAPSIEHICQACHYNLGLSHVGSGTSYWAMNQSNKLTTGETGAGVPHENRPSYYAVKFCIKGSDEKFDYTDDNTENPKDNWVKYEDDIGDWYDVGAKKSCYRTTQVDNSDPSNVKTYTVDICQQDQKRDTKGREINTRNSQIRYNGINLSDNRTIETQESWQPYDVYYTECDEYGGPYDCSAFTPPTSDILYGTLFTQTKECSVARHRYKITRERNWINGSLRNVSSIEESCSPTTKETYTNAVGTRVDPFSANINAGAVTVNQSGRTTYFVGAFSVADSLVSASAGNTIRNELNYRVMIVSDGINGSCANSLYVVNGNTSQNNGNPANTAAWLKKFTTLTLYTPSGGVYAKYSLTDQYTNGNYSVKKFGSGCNLNSNWFSSPGDVDTFTLDDK